MKDFVEYQHQTHLTANQLMIQAQEHFHLVVLPILKTLQISQQQ